jgi:ubiquitin-protein ligase
MHKEGDNIYELASAHKDVEQFELSNDSGYYLKRFWKWKKKQDEKHLTRLQVATQIFETFLDKQAAFDYAHRVGLISFGSEVVTLQPVTSLFDSFRSSLKAMTADGDTKMRDAVVEAINQLVKIRASFPNNPLLRVIVLTDGIDNKSTASLAEVIELARTHGIVIDGLAVNPKQIDKDLRAMTFASGGACFLPASTLEQLQIGELEVLLRLHEREYEVPKNPMLRQNVVPFDDLEENKPKRRSEPAKPAKRQLVIRKGKKNAGVLRLMNEFKVCREAKHPAYEVFVPDDQMYSWKCIMLGPSSKSVEELESPYAGGVFVLSLTFPEDYPMSPPLIRFETPIKHVNLNSYGKVCHDILGRAYDVDYSISHILNSVYGLLLTPEVDSPIDTALASLYHENNAEYIDTIKKAVLKHATRPLDLVLKAVTEGGSLE